MQTVDIIFARLLMGLVLFEFFADQQQWDFHKAKAYFQDTAKVPAKYTRADVERGFCTTGLWSFSRHPNFLAEQSCWVMLYQWSCWTTNSLYSWAGLGAASYLILFQSSTWLTEKISARKYPQYKEYQARVGKFMPKIGGGWDDYVEEQEKKNKTN